MEKVGEGNDISIENDSEWLELANVHHGPIWRLFTKFFFLSATYYEQKGIVEILI